MQATLYDPRNLARIATHLASVLNQSDKHDDNDAAAERAQARTMVGLVDNGDGMMRAYGCFTPEAADIILTALAPLAAPQPAADGTPDPRSAARRTGEALVELCRRALDRGDLLPGSRGTRPHVTITSTIEAGPSGSPPTGIRSSSHPGGSTPINDPARPPTRTTPRCVRFGVSVGARSALGVGPARRPTGREAHRSRSFRTVTTCTVRHRRLRRPEGIAGPATPGRR